MSVLPPAGHRPWPPPGGPWAVRQSWCGLAFLHWRVPVDAVRQKVPAGVEVDVFDGSAWLGVVPFTMEAVRVRGLPPVPGTTGFPELNVRTYVTANGKPGVWFLSLDATSAIVVAIARAWYGLPYFRARMEVVGEAGGFSYASERRHPGAVPATLRARFGPAGPEFRALPGSLEHWLTERYCLYATTRGGGICRADIHHAPWPLRPGRAVITANTMAAAAGFDLPPDPPHVLYARRIDAVAWAPVKI
ncbi:MAG: DUF2071 domain-containing protein [Planctomycetes bacterium]|nr:DUF2071 domain-containing protein [Planctomycetota bacterium]